MKGLNTWTVVYENLNIFITAFDPGVILFDDKFIHLQIVTYSVKLIDKKNIEHQTMISSRDKRLILTITISLLERVDSSDERDGADNKFKLCRKFIRCCLIELVII